MPSQTVIRNQLGRASFGTGTAAQRWSVADALRHSAHGKQLRKRVDYVIARDAAIQIQGQALSRKRIDEREPLRGPAAGRAVEQEVPALDEIPKQATPTKAAILAAARTPVFF